MPPKNAQSRSLRPPVFRTAGRVYRTDTCRPQVDALRGGKIAYHALARGHYPGARLPEGALPGVSCIGFWDAIGAQDWGLELHRNEGVEIACMETGGMPFVVDGASHALRAGDLTITRPWQLHSHGHPLIGPGRIHWVIIDVGVRRPHEAWQWPAWVVLSQDDRRELTRRLRQNERPVWKATDEVLDAFRSIAGALADHAPRAALSPVTVYLNALLLHLLEMLREARTPAPPALAPAERTVELFLHDLEENAASLTQDWTLESMARECGLRPTAFAKYCRRLMNTSPLQHLSRLRLRQAAAMLRAQPRLTVTEIAFAVGFHSSQYFSTQFHRHFRCTPKAYRAAGQAAARGAASTPSRNGVVAPP